ncbi:MAG: M1 family peptidase [Bacteroidetes bacterium]|nr:MAG: M1 family peptidase [Bacteroidota bacterium]
MKTRFLTLFFSLLSLGLFSQQAYFQQQVDYTIDVTLNDKDHTVSGTIKMVYTNNSPDDLAYLYMHLWPNAFKNTSTAFAKQQVRTGSTRFYFSNENNRGRIDNLDFTVDGEKAVLKPDPKHADINILYLNTPLKSGQTITIESPFLVKIPASFSRLGHVGQSYQMTQWYPKPAVYDRNGWHQMPYLDMGEFYSEFGSFDVSITLPQNYVVGATGTLQTDSEYAFLEEQIKTTDTYFDTLSSAATGYVREAFPASAEKMKTIRYTADNVHDFAWFADKRFKVRKSDVTLASGKKVDTWVMFTKTNEAYWKNAVDYVSRSVKFYSDQVGEYPYPQATAIQSALSAGGGMEYPMITVIGRTGSAKSLDEVITHEVGHNWFYGILASNERDHAWMDEGLNSFYEGRYMTKYYGRSDYYDYIPEFLMKGTDMDLFELAYAFFKRKGRSQACDTHSDDMYAPNYLIGAYLKPPIVLTYLEKYVGLETFDKAMQEYYAQWKFKHPQPEDFERVMETSIGQDLDWIFQDMFMTDKAIDYAVTGIKEAGDNYEITMKNKGGIAGPFKITGMEDSSTVITRGFEGFEGKTKVSLPKGKYDLVVVDQNRSMPDLYRKNNNIKTSGLLKKFEPLKLKFLAGAENSKQSTLYFLPLPAYNAYDGFMLGSAFYNRGLLSKKFEFHIAPFFGFKSKSLAGFGDIHYNFMPDGLFRQIRIGLNTRRFHFNENDIVDYNLAYNRFMPYIDLTFNSNLAYPVSNRLILSTTILNKEVPEFDQGSGEFLGLDNSTNSFFVRAVFDRKNKRVINPNAFQVGLEWNEIEYFFQRPRHLKAWVEVNAAYTYAAKRNIEVRLFAGGFLKNDQSAVFPPYPDALNLSPQGFNDYRFESFFFGRNESSGLWAQQIGNGEGGMKLPLGSAYALGRSGSFLAAINLKADLPRKLTRKIPLKPYFDLGYYNDQSFIGDEHNILWSGGLMLEILDGSIEIYFPIISSEEIENVFKERGNYWSRIGFKFDLNTLNPWELLEEALVP